MQLKIKPSGLAARMAVVVILAQPAWLLAQLTPVPAQPRMGQPLAGLSETELARFLAGRVDFDTDFVAADGLGPIFNNNSCGACHITPLGGSGDVTVTRFGTYIKDEFDPLEELGGSLLQSAAISPECMEVIPPGAYTALRATNSTLGMGLVEAIPDAAIEAHELDPPGGFVSGRVHWVIPLEDDSPMPEPRAGRFGWKAQVATALTFSGDAALNEMGLTNRLVPTENAPNGNEELLAQCDTIPDPEDGPDQNGLDFIDRVTDFQRFLAAPPQTPRAGMSGEALFMNVQCGDCHVPSFTTADVETLEPALRNKVIKPYSDFLLHDMGLLGDGIVQGDASDREMRTPSLWGLRIRDPLLHNASVTGGTFADRVAAAIAAHNAFLSEAAASAGAYDALLPEQKAAVIAFLDSLGRAEFDHSGDNAVNLGDVAALSVCVSGPMPAYNPDHACAVADINQDDDVDLFDWASFQNAFAASAF